MEISARPATVPAYLPPALPSESTAPFATDAELMCQARDGDIAAFETLFFKHGPHVIELASHFVRTRNRAEEIAQDAFLRVFRQRARYTSRISFTAQLYRVAADLCSSELRRTDSNPEANGAELRHAPADIPARFRAAVDRLPADQKLAFLLARIDALLYPDIAEMLGASEFTVKCLVFTATETVRATLRDLLPD